MKAQIIKTSTLFSMILLVSFFMSCKPLSTEKNLNINTLIQPLTKDGIFRDSLYYNWGSSIIKGNDGKYHLFYSRWQRKYSFYGWLTHSEIAHAVSDTPFGQWHYVETVLKGRGNGHWDEITAHNPKIKYFEGKYYLYYIATNFGGKGYSEEDLKFLSNQSTKNPDRLLLRENQRTGVAVSASLNGPWKRMGQPVIEPSGPIETLTVNPAIALGKNGTYYLIVKGDKPNDPGFVRNQAIATAKTPVGPFRMQPNPVIGNLDTEDASMWYSEKNDTFYAVFHAHTYIGLMTSTNGLHWEKAPNYIITDKKVVLDNGSFLIPDRMERPFIFVEDNKPKVLSLAVKKGDDSFSIFLPLKADK